MFLVCFCTVDLFPVPEPVMGKAVKYRRHPLPSSRLQMELRQRLHHAVQLDSSAGLQAVKGTLFHKTTSLVTVKKPVKVAFEHPRWGTKPNASRQMLSWSLRVKERNTCVHDVSRLTGKARDPMICRDSRTLRERKPPDFISYILPSSSDADIVRDVDGFPISEHSKQTQALVCATFVQPVIIDYQRKRAKHACGNSSVYYIFGSCPLSNNTLLLSLSPSPLVPTYII
ncbi:hypothetical protein CPC08DRAFT_806854 [Agrocybe pediades]|nr:hypothetical protein CPC08DRAFT_806854 [Agrocybe pediades]